MGCSLFELLTRSEVGFVHEIKIYRFSRSGPFCRGFFGVSKIVQAYDQFCKSLNSTHWWRTTPPTRGLHRFPLNNGAIPEHATTRLRDWIIGLSPAKGSNGDPQTQTRRFISTELTDQFLLFIDEPPFTVLRLGSFIRSFCLLPHQLSLATTKEQLARCNGLPRNRDKPQKTNQQKARTNISNQTTNKSVITAIASNKFKIKVPAINTSNAY